MIRSIGRAAPVGDFGDAVSNALAVLHDFNLSARSVAREANPELARGDVWRYTKNLDTQLNPGFPVIVASCYRA